MRKEMERYYGKRIAVVGTFKKVLHKSGKAVALFEALESGGEFLCSHTYVQCAETMEAYGFNRDERIQFDALVVSYRKFNPERNAKENDFGLSRPAAIRSLDREIELPSLSPKQEAPKAPKQEAEPVKQETTKKAPVQEADSAKRESPRLTRAALVGEVMRLADAAGGLDRLREVIGFLCE